ncbi:MAG: PadR family transcriptional regulator [Clostridia bacterium]
MARGRSNFKMGTVELLVLFLLDKQDLYGYQITALIEKLSEGNVIVTESTLYPTLYKLLEKKSVSDYEVAIGKRRMRVYYHLENIGRQRLSDLIEDYNEITIGISKILNSDISLEESDDINTKERN